MEGQTWSRILVYRNEDFEFADSISQIAKREPYDEISLRIHT